MRRCRCLQELARTCVDRVLPLRCALSVTAATLRKWCRRRCCARGEASEDFAAAPASRPGCIASPSTKPTATSRRARADRALPLGSEHLQVGSSPDHEPPRQAEYHELLTALESALFDLPLPYRTAVVLRDIDGLSTRDAAKIAGVGEAAFKSRLHQARLRLRTSLGDDALIGAGE